MGKGKTSQSTYIGSGYLAEPDIRAILDNGIARAAEVDIHVVAVVHTELAARYHHDAMLHPSDVSGAVDLTADKEAFFDTSDSQTGIGLSIGSGDGHVHDTVPQIRYRCRNRGG